jgi:hypothetical protein
MNYLIHATPAHPSLYLQYLILLFTIATITVFTLLLLLLFYYCHHYKTIATDKLLQASLFLGAAELTTHMLRLINILWLPLCQINKFGFYFPRRLLRSPILVGHQPTRWEYINVAQHVKRSQRCAIMDELNSIAGNKIEPRIANSNDQILGNTTIIEAKWIAYWHLQFNDWKTFVECTGIFTYFHDPTEVHLPKKSSR